MNYWGQEMPFGGQGWNPGMFGYPVAAPPFNENHSGPYNGAAGGVVNPFHVMQMNMLMACLDQNVQAAANQGQSAALAALEQQAAMPPSAAVAGAPQQMDASFDTAEADNGAAVSFISCFEELQSHAEGAVNTEQQQQQQQQRQLSRKPRGRSKKTRADHQGQMAGMQQQQQQLFYSMMTPPITPSPPVQPTKQPHSGFMGQFPPPSDFGGPMMPQPPFAMPLREHYGDLKTVNDPTFGHNGQYAMYSMGSLFACNFCGHTSNSLATLKTHVLLHPELLPYFCAKCGDMQVFRADHQKHVANCKWTDKDNAVFECPSTVFYYGLHKSPPRRDKEEAADQLSCNRCKLNCVNKMALRLHWCKIGGNGIGVPANEGLKDILEDGSQVAENRVECTMCMASFLNIGDLVIHSSRSHLLAELTAIIQRQNSRSRRSCRQCHLCFASFPTISSLAGHVGLKHCLVMWELVPKKAEFEGLINIACPIKNCRYTDKSRTHHEWFYHFIRSHISLDDRLTDRRLLEVPCDECPDHQQQQPGPAQPGDNNNEEEASLRLLHGQIYHNQVFHDMGPFEGFDVVCAVVTHDVNAKIR